jgi:hypothetical protein
MKIIFEAKKKLPMIRVHLLKRMRREVKVGPKLGGQWKDPKLGGQWKDPKLGGQWKVPSLVANGRFQAWWPLECSKLGGHGRIQSLVANGRFQAWWLLEGSKAWWPIRM